MSDHFNNSGSLGATHVLQSLIKILIKTINKNRTKTSFSKVLVYK